MTRLFVKSENSDKPASVRLRSELRDTDEKTNSKIQTAESLILAQDER